MRRLLKIICITFFSLLLTLIVLAAGGAAVLCYVVFTPERLTPLLKEVSAPYIKGEMDVERVNLTFLSTFPDAGLAIHGLTITHSMEGSACDTLLHLPLLEVGLDVEKAIRGDIHLHVLRAEGIRAHLYIAEDGSANYDILSLPTDTTAADTTESGWSLRSVDFDDALTATINYFRLQDLRDSADVDIAGADLFLQAEDPLGETPSVLARVYINKVSATYKEVPYVHDAHVSVVLPVCVSPDQTLVVDAAEVVYNQFRLSLSAVMHDFQLSGPWDELDVSFRTNTWNIGELLALVPMVDFAMPDSIEREVDMDVRLSAHLNLNDFAQSRVKIDQLDAHARNSHLRLSGTVSDITGDIQINMMAQAEALIPDFRYYIPEDMQLDGAVRADLNLDVKMSELEQLALKTGTVRGEVQLRDLDFTMSDSLYLQSDSLAMRFVLPRGSSMACLKAQTNCQLANLQLRMTDGPEAVLGSVSLQAEGEYDTRDTTAIPTLRADFQLSEVSVLMDTISAYLRSPRGKINLSGTRRDKSEPRFSASISADSISTRVGEMLRATTSALGVKVAARHRSGQENILLTWNPRLDFDVQNALAITNLIPYDVKVPEIKFNYSNRAFVIDTSRIELGNSDFNLAGMVKNIPSFLEHKGLLEGELRFTSGHSDINQLLDLVNGFGNDEEELAAADLSQDTLSVGRLQLKQEANPFIVPKGVDLTLLTRIDTAHAFGETLRNVGGKVYVKDGVMMVEEMGFLCEAAQMKLTGIYRTPRRNHLFAGLDFHLTNVHIAELINMIPQVDSILPMLRSFRGRAEVHLAAETYLNAYYQLKPSTTRGALSISANDLTLLDGETFSTIAKLLTFKKSSENKIDSISADISLYKQQVTVYPFLIHYDRWKVAAGGNHNLAGYFDYHIDLLKPAKIGVDVLSREKKDGGTGFNIKLSKCLYADDFTPVKTGVVETNAMSIRKLISTSLRKSDTTPNQQNEK